MARQHRAALRKHHAPRQVRARKPPPQLAIDEITHPPCRQTRRYTGRDKISHLQPRPLARIREPQHGSDHAQQSAVKRHSALPHRKNLQRMAQVIARLVEQAVANAPTRNHPGHAQKQDVFDIFARPRTLPPDGHKRLVMQAANAQKHEQAKRGQISQAIPVNGQRADLQGNGINVGVGQHVGRYCARPRANL